MYHLREEYRVCGETVMVRHFVVFMCTVETKRISRRYYHLHLRRRSSRSKSICPSTGAAVVLAVVHVLVAAASLPLFRCHPLASCSGRWQALFKLTSGLPTWLA